MIFNSYSNILPDPDNPITQAGQATTQGEQGPGFAEFSLVSSQQVQSSKTRSGRSITRQNQSHLWSLNIQYNPLQRDQFQVVQAFLLRVRSRSRPFFVVIPTHNRPKDENFFNFCLNNQVRVVGSAQAGSQAIKVDTQVNRSGIPRVGDLFNIVDPLNVNHQNLYKVVGVQTSTNRLSSNTLGPRQMVLHIYPTLQRLTNNNSQLRFINPKLRVYQPNATHQQQVGNSNLYSFSLSLQEYLS